MAICPIGFDWDTLRGEFKHTETRKWFQFFDSDRADLLGWENFPHEIFVGPDGDTRMARVLKTVAYVIVDEAADGSPVVEKWPLRSDWVRA